jgi:ATP-dependent DNA ligase
MAYAGNPPLASILSRKGNLARWQTRLRAPPACDDNGVASFDLVSHHRANESVFLYAFDLIELNGDDLRRDPLEVRKATLRTMLAKAGLGLRFNEHIEGDGPTVFAHACKMGLEGVPRKWRRQR